jgi:hypothetical protein
MLDKIKLWNPHTDDYDYKEILPIFEKCGATIEHSIDITWMFIEYKSKKRNRKCFINLLCLKLC